MKYKLLLENFRKNVQLNEDEETLFESLVEERKVRRKHILLQEGQHNHHLYFVISGCLRAYSIDKNGFHHILQFAPADWWITDMYSYVTGEPSSLNIDALEETTFLSITKENQELAYREIPKLERHFRILMEKNLVTNRKRIIDRLSLTAMERFKTFCHTYPDLINKIPQKQVASYIGITPEFLSKVRSEYLKSL
ncbi:MAG: Crp/Fnr family transcriptional regulator [Saprospiraceae bacterium]|nr:Crp/Fnr family transcriptional regulator [Saprospiraceae bacterium]